MPTLRDYEGLAPFSLDELVDASNSVLRDRPKLHVSKRTVRYYIQSGVLPPPLGSPKYARYGMDHLLRLVGARCLLDQGQPLQSAARELEALVAGPLPMAMEHVQRLIDSQRGTEIHAAPRLYAPAPQIAESRDVIYKFARRSPPEHSVEVDEVRRIRLTNEATLEVRGTNDLPSALRDAAEALENLLADS